jgi:hypothetical protein
VSHEAVTADAPEVAALTTAAALLLLLEAELEEADVVAATAAAAAAVATVEEEAAAEDDDDEEALVEVFVEVELFDFFDDEEEEEEAFFELLEDPVAETLEALPLTGEETVAQLDDEGLLRAEGVTGSPSVKVQVEMMPGAIATSPSQLSKTSFS